MGEQLLKNNHYICNVFWTSQRILGFDEWQPKTDKCFHLTAVVGEIAKFNPKALQGVKE